MPFILVLLIPTLYGLANLGDKYIVSKRAFATDSYLVIVGGVHVAIGLALALFLDWRYPWHDLALAIPCGVVYAAQLYVYYFLFAAEDASNIVSLEFAYPVLLAVLTYVFLGERISGLGYVGMLLVVAGLVAVTVRMQQVRLDARPWMILALIASNALNDFFVKIAAGRLPGPLGLAIESLVAGSLICGLLLKPGVRQRARRELANLRYAVVIECLTLASILCKFLSMARMPAVFVASITAIQPLLVLGGEQLFLTGASLRKDTALAPKLIGVALVVAGVMLLVWSMAGGGVDL